MLGVDNGGIHICKNTEVIGHANVIPVAGYSVADNAFADLAVLKRIDHLVLERHSAYPMIRLDRHPVPPIQVAGSPSPHKTAWQRRASYPSAFTLTTCNCMSSIGCR